MRQNQADAVEGIENQSVTTSNFGETMEVLTLSHTEVTLLRTSFDLLLANLGVLEIRLKGNACWWLNENGGIQLYPNLILLFFCIDGVQGTWGKFLGQNIANSSPKKWLNTVPECNLYCKRVYILVWFTWFTIFYGWAN